MKYIIEEIQDGILIITLNRPKALNALNPKLILEIGASLKKIEEDSNIYGAILTGSGDKAFAAGADIKGFPELDANAGSALAREGQEVFNYIERFPKPVIAAVNGYALGGGCELTMACHMRIAGENAVFGQPEVNLGLIPGYGGTQRLPQLIGKAKAIEFTLTGKNISANEALALGLANHVVESGNEVEFSKGIIHKIAKKGPNAVATAIECINASFNKQIDGFELEIQRFGERMASEECKEGVAAFIEKRKANFR